MMIHNDSKNTETETYKLSLEACLKSTVGSCTVYSMVYFGDMQLSRLNLVKTRVTFCSALHT